MSTQSGADFEVPEMAPDKVKQPRRISERDKWLRELIFAINSNLTALQARQDKHDTECDQRELRNSRYRTEFREETQRTGERILDRMERIREEMAEDVQYITAQVENNKRDMEREIREHSERVESYKRYTDGMVNKGLLWLLGLTSTGLLAFILDKLGWVKFG